MASEPRLAALRTTLTDLLELRPHRLGADTERVLAVGAGFERTESRRESNRAASGRRATAAWHMQNRPEPRVASRNPQTRTPNR